MHIISQLCTWSEVENWRVGEEEGARLGEGSGVVGRGEKGDQKAYKYVKL